VEEDGELTGDADDGDFLRRPAAGGMAQTPIAEGTGLTEARKHILCALHE